MSRDKKIVARPPVLVDRIVIQLYKEGISVAESILLSPARPRLFLRVDRVEDGRHRTGERGFEERYRLCWR